MTGPCFSLPGMVGEVGLRTYEGVSQRIYSPPPLPLGTLPRRRTSHPRGRAFPLAGRVYGEPLARCQPRENGSGGPSMRPRPRRFLRLKRRHRGRCRAEHPTGLILHRRHGSVAPTAGPSMRQRGPRPPATHPPRARPPRKTGWNRKPERSRPPRGGEARAGDGAVILYGWHTVKAALENPARRIPTSVRHRERRAPPVGRWPGGRDRDRAGPSGRDRAPART